MTSLLTDMLVTLNEADAPLTIKDLSRKLAIDQRVALDMLDYWERRGKIRLSEGAGCPTTGADSCSCCPVKGCDGSASASKRYEIIPT